MDDKNTDRHNVGNSASYRDYSSVPYEPKDVSAAFGQASDLSLDTRKETDQDTRGEQHQESESRHRKVEEEFTTEKNQENQGQMRPSLWPEFLKDGNNQLFFAVISLTFSVVFGLKALLLPIYFLFVLDDEYRKNSLALFLQWTALILPFIVAIMGIVFSALSMAFNTPISHLPA